MAAAAAIDGGGSVSVGIGAVRLSTRNAGEPWTDEDADDPPPPFSG